MGAQQLEEKEFILARSLKQCYEDGRNGAKGYPLNAEEIIAAQKAKGEKCSAFVQGFVALFVSQMNAEYERGRKEAGI